MADETTPLLSRRRRAPPFYAYPAIVAGLLLLFLLAAVASGYNLTGDEDTWVSNLGAYAPFVSLRVSGLPTGCRIDQVTVLHRHTGRYPTPGASERLRATLAKLANATVPAHASGAAFLRAADFEMHGWEFGELTDPGRRAAWDSGKDLRRRYDLPPFTRSAGGSRVLESARLFLQGLQGADYDPKAWPAIDLVIPEGDDANNTLCVHNCAAQRTGSAGVGERADVLHLLAPASARLSKLLSIDLEPEDIPNIAGMCGFDTARTGGWSAWCHLLHPDEWEAVGYVAEVERWYAFGGGSPYSRTMGAGWVNELIARLTDSPVSDNTCTNRTLDANPKTFPLGKRLFIDFTHDNEMVAIQAALGIKRHLPTSTDKVPERQWVLSSLVPFGARWSFERVVCGKERYLRMLVK
ncbi:phosphoglycerate mutase-like protein [Cutaneotrichosporon oleaginosum]|uniref:Phytase A n=1 Tax=Cutaneotrichosporon oleaginosum TaxID=879819 RepID=A0A0J1B219_9TREE|nr:phosphoglycerate mutase-like protein [Cutaneotrichosporon oleaginosum]KLT41664.1 phosphoglycerate mutase-like protein [Cutaneotrichosporon oleaginosum]TXT08036.1 hypothetical protein COLE_04960 [Cutaneotrichosporon oleaginosum]